MIAKLSLVRHAILLAGIFIVGSAASFASTILTLNGARVIPLAPFTLVPVATPVFSPAAGAYTRAQSVTITSATPGASIAYTTDGSIPTVIGGTITHGALYSGPITVSPTTTLSAIAFEGGYLESALAIGGYSLQTAPDFAATPFVTLPNSNVLYSFPASGSDGNSPALELAKGTDGNFYGMTSAGGAGGLGTIFKITPAGVLTTLVSFTGTTGAFQGSAPHGVLALGSDGNFYGTTGTGGALNFGTAFKVTPAGAFTTLVTFSGTIVASLGSNPRGVILGSDGNFYGVTNSGGTSNAGTIFKMTPTGGLTTLLSFDGVHNGQFPTGSLVQGIDGNFYGATVDGLIGNTTGTIFSVTPSGVLTTLFTFNGTNGYAPLGGLTQGSDGNFYGTTNEGGTTFVNAASPGDGTIFKMTSGGTLTSLVSFTGLNGDFPRSRLLLGADGNFYGSTSNGGSTYVSSSNTGTGSVFQLTPAGGLTTLVSFTGTTGAFPGSAPFGGLVQGTDGNLYGVTQTGGAANVGVFFQLPMAAAPTFSPVAGTYTSAQTVTISTPTSGASIRYTTDGSTPTETNGTLYSGPVKISATSTLQAIAFMTGDLNSPGTSGTYTINIPAPASGGGGGAFDEWFLGFLALAGLLRWKLRKIQPLA